MSTPQRPLCFVLMPFGQKPDATGARRSSRRSCRQREASLLWETWIATSKQWTSEPALSCGKSVWYVFALPERN